MNTNPNNLYLKVVTSWGRYQRKVGPYSQFNFDEYMPVDNKPGKWTREYKSLILCRRGWHATDADHLAEWVKISYNDQVYVVQVRGKIKADRNKLVASQMRFICKVTTKLGTVNKYNGATIDRAYEKALAILKNEEIENA